MEQAVHVVQSLGKSESSIEETAPIPKKEETSSKSAKKSIEKGARKERVTLKSQKLGEMEKDELPVEFEEKFTPKKEIPVQRRESSKSVERVAKSESVQGVSVDEETVAAFQPEEKMAKETAK